MVLIDTHVAVFLAGMETQRLTPKGYGLINENDIFLSEISRLELQYLYEIKRVLIPPSEVINFLHEKIGLVMSKASTASLVDAAYDLTWTRDPFDRLICSDAKAQNSLLLTKDKKILEHFDLAVW